MTSSSVKLSTDDYTGGRVRSAFPAYRVFIFGEEVTSDVIEARVNHSGGSAERSAGTCSFTLVNPDNKYTLTYADMLLIGESAAAYREYRKRQWVDNGFGGTTPLEVQKLQQAASQWEDQSQIPEEYEKFIVEYKQRGLEDEIPQELLDRVAKRDQGIVENKEAIENTYKDLAKQMTEESYANPFSALNVEAFNVDSLGNNTLKANVLSEKLKFYTDVTYNTATNLAKLEDRTLMEYPFHQGDCIFHPNDPVRVAFRDPFDPRIWYWMFTGFMDAWTENSGVNRDATVTINCTDVTKIARYSFIQVGTGLQDPDITDVFFQIDPTTQASKHVLYFKQLFAQFTMLEALETLFFGTDSAIVTAEDAIRAQVSLQSPEALNQSLQQIDPATYEKSRAFEEDTQFKIDMVTDDRVQQRKKAIKQAGNLPPICVPAPYMKQVDKGDATTDNYDAKSGTVIAKKKNSRSGVHAYFYGELTEYDKTLGEGLVSLNWWNERIHHRVRGRDLVDMALNESTYRNAKLEYMLPSSIITRIGTDKTGFPVGHGRVYYVSRAQLADGSFGRQIIDREFGGTSGLFSVFKDKLSYIYDMAERVDFRFYATPRGDFVYEMPFYDFDPIYFVSDTTEDWELKPGQVDDVADLLARDTREIPFSQQDLEAIGFFKDPEQADDIKMWGNAEPFNYIECFTIERDEQISFSNTSTDQGVATVFRCKPNTVASMSTTNGDFKQYQYVADKGALFTLGVRVADADVWGYITSEEEAEAYAALMLARTNAEAKNVSVATLPKFGLMVNRPLFWRERNYYANIVSLQHSVVWASSADTTINLNQLRGWSGETHPETGYPIHRHFSGSDRPFSMGEISTQKTKKQNTQG